MTSEELKSELQKINIQINQLKEKDAQIRNKYISENAEFEIGEKVLIGKGTKKERFAFVRSINIYSFNCTINYEFWKCKKDGTKELISDYCYSETKDKM